MKILLNFVLDPPVWAFAIGIVVLFAVITRFIPRDGFYTLVVAIMVSLVAVEGLCRFFDIGAPAYYVWQQDRVTDKPYSYRPSSLLRYRYSNNPRGYFDANNEVIGTINSKGFRGDETSFDKTNGVFRIAVLGDSFTLGIGVRDEDTFPANLERLLREQGLSVEVLNFGIGGSNTSGQVRLLENYVLEFQPDMAIFVIFLNDTNRVGTIRYIPGNKILKKVRNLSFFLNLLIGEIERRVSHYLMIRHYREGYREDNPSWANVKSVLTRAKQRLESEDIQMVVSVYPVLFHLNGNYPFRGIHRKIAEFCRLNEIPFVDLLDAFSGQTDSELWVHSSDQHPNDIAHRLAAGTLEKFVARQIR